MIEQTYSIKDLEDISGIKTHTLRAWERRYKIFTPNRTATNIRFYSDNDLKKLLNISLLLDYGMKISSASALKEEDLHEKVRSMLITSDYDSVISRLIIDMIDFNQNSFENNLNKVIFDLGFEEAVYRVIYPFFKKVAILWLASSINPAQEHFVSNIIRHRFLLAIYSLERPSSGSKSFILFLPEKEMHELGLLMSQYLLVKNGNSVIYLGQNTPMIDVIKTWRATKADFLVSHLTSHIEKENLLSYLKELSEGVEGTKILISGTQISTIKDSPINNVEYLFNPSDLNKILKKV